MHLTQTQFTFWLNYNLITSSIIEYPTLGNIAQQYTSALTLSDLLHSQQAKAMNKTFHKILFFTNYWHNNWNNDQFFKLILIILKPIKQYKYVLHVLPQSVKE